MTNAIHSALLAACLGVAVAPIPTSAAETLVKTALKPLNVTVRVFDPAKGISSGQDYVLPVDSPDAEHAAASTMANAVSFTRKIEGGSALSVAFACIKVEPR